MNKRQEPQIECRWKYQENTCEPLTKIKLVRDLLNLKKYRTVSK